MYLDWYILCSSWHRYLRSAFRVSAGYSKHWTCHGYLSL